jgi:hypothetical protein
MHRLRVSFRRHPAHFGRRTDAVAMPAERATNLVDDLRLFAAFFLGGFVFMTVYLA